MIFVSYAWDDRGRVRALVEALRQLDLEVSWDQDFEIGDRPRTEVEAAIGRAAWVVAVWTEASKKSSWVQAEADLAWRRKRLKSVRLDADPPLPFGAYVLADLPGWSEQSGPGDLPEQLIETLRKAPVDTVPPPVTPLSGRSGARRRSKAIFAVAGLAVLVGLGVGTAVAALRSKDVAERGLTPVLPPDPTGRPPAQPGSGGSPAAAPSESPNAGTGGAPAKPPRRCCHETGAVRPCPKPSCSDCDLVDCPK